MRNYIGISQFKEVKQVNKLQYFDDEYFIILRNNRPVYIAFPDKILDKFDEKFHFGVDILSIRELINNTLKVDDNRILHILKNNKKYYNIIPYGSEESDFIHNNLISKNKEELYEELGV